MKNSIDLVDVPLIKTIVPSIYRGCSWIFMDVSYIDRGFSSHLWLPNHPFPPPWWPPAIWYFASDPRSDRSNWAVVTGGILKFGHVKIRQNFPTYIYINGIIYICKYIRSAPPQPSHQRTMNMTLTCPTPPHPLRKPGAPRVYIYIYVHTIMFIAYPT